MKSLALSLLAFSLLSIGAAVAGPSNPATTFTGDSARATTSEGTQKALPTTKACHQAAKSSSQDMKCQASGSSCATMKHS